jgi:hypothetical protein
MKGKVIYVDFTQKHQKYTSRKISLFKRLLYFIRSKFSQKKSTESSINTTRSFKRIL